MEHARKMVIVPEDSLHRIQHEQTQQQENEEEQSKSSLLTTRTPGTFASRLDESMYELLNSAYPKDERSRWKLYNQVLHRYLNVMGRSSLRVDSEEKIEETLNETEGDGGSYDNLESIVSDIPPRYREKAKLLLQRVTSSSRRFTWDPRSGLVSIDDDIIPNSNISDLMNDFARNRKTEKAIGRERVARFFQEINVPKSLIGNYTLRRDRQNSTSSNETFVSFNNERTLRPTPMRTSSPQKKKKTQSLTQNTTQKDLSTEDTAEIREKTKRAKARKSLKEYRVSLRDILHKNNRNTSPEPMNRKRDRPDTPMPSTSSRSQLPKRRRSKSWESIFLSKK